MQYDTEHFECSLILADLSGFTQMLYQASHSEETLRDVLHIVFAFFARCGKTAAQEKIEIINHTGDGFIAMATGETPSRTALEYCQRISRSYRAKTYPQLCDVPFRQRVDFRAALHHGSLCRVRIPDFDKENYLFFGDDLNVLARVVNTQTARRFGIATTRAFYRRLMLRRTDDFPDEVIGDRNKYPEQIEVFRVPEEIPDHKNQ